jgi:hypothetical protein
MYYLTISDAPSGVYVSQVIDVCKFISDRFKIQVRLIAIISFKGFKKNKAFIQNKYPNSIILPMVPKLTNWKLNYYSLALLLFFNKPKPIISRGPLATFLALKMKKHKIVTKVCFDGRGAYAAEWNEYKVVPDENLKSQIFDLEKIAINESDFRIAVSNKLVRYWFEKFGYQWKNHVVIPCTLGKIFSISKIANDNILEKRKEFNYKEDDIILTYSGSNAGWQSFNIIDLFFTKILEKNNNAQIILLIKSGLENFKSATKFPGRVKQMWLEYDKVQEVLSISDYGILIREQSVTNEVASPTKFAEYLSAGLPVIISEGLGDYSEFVQQNDCGIVWKENMDIFPFLKPTGIERKVSMIKIAQKYFVKESYLQDYQTLTQFLIE